MRVLVLGAGYAGVTLARALEDRLPPAATLTVVDAADAHLVQHEVHRVIRRPALADVIRVPLADVFDRADVVRGRVDRIDRAARRVELADGTELDYDYAAVCLGARTAYYGLPGVCDHSTPLKRVDHALDVREEFEDACESGGTAVVGGAGLSGVQVAGELAALADERACDASVVLLEQADDVAPSFPANFRRAVRDALDAAGVDVRTGATVTRATEEAIELADGELPYDQFVWTGGITGRAAMGDDRPVVRSDLRLDDATFAVGDAARVVDADGEAVPASAATAIRQARVAAENVARLAERKTENAGGFTPRLERYRHDVPGWAVSVGDAAVAQLGPTVVTGAAARAAKTTVGAGYLRSMGAIRNAVELAEAEFGG